MQLGLGHPLGARPAPSWAASRLDSRHAAAPLAAHHPAAHHLHRPRRLLTTARAAPLEATAFDPVNPPAFYLLEGQVQMEALTDATLLVEGRRLPVHSQVLSVQSGVLRALFADLHSSEESAGTRSRWRRLLLGSEDGMVLEEPFRDCTLQDTLVFLRFCYRPDDRTPANLAAVLESLPGLLRLAHRLDAPRIQQAVVDFMMATDHLRSASLPQLVEWVAAADHCQLHGLRERCIVQLASRLVARPGGLLLPAFANAALVAERCSKGVVANVMALLGAAASAGLIPGSGATAGVAHQPAATEALHRQATHGGPAWRSRLETIAEAALDEPESATSGSFEWVLERYTEHFSAVGDQVCSPWFSAAGADWRFKVYPGGDVEESAGHLSVYLECMQPGTRAKWALTLVDQAWERPQDIISGSDQPSQFDGGRGAGALPGAGPKLASYWGCARLATHRELRSRPGYLAGDRLVLRARVEVVP